MNLQVLVWQCSRCTEAQNLHPFHLSISSSSVHQFHMPGRPFSKTAQRQINRQKHNSQMALALHIHKSELAHPAGEIWSQNKITKDMGVSTTTFRRLIKGGVPLSKFNASKQLLSDAEQQKLVEYAISSADHGFPLTHWNIKYANLLLRSHPDGRWEVGKNWVDCFIESHQEVLQSHWNKQLDMAQAKQLNKAIVNHWFKEIVKEHYIDEGILPKNTYRMDESGFPLAATQTQRVIGHQGTLRPPICREKQTTRMSLLWWQFALMDQCSGPQSSSRARESKPGGELIMTSKPCKFFHQQIS